MKKIVIGMIQTTLSPFIVVLGYYLLKEFSISEPAMITASAFGITSISLNFFIGCALTIRGYHDVKAFEGW